MAVVYSHMKKDSREIYYIGIGKDIKRAYHTGSRSEIWKRHYAKYGLIVDILCNNIDLDSAKNIEKFLIAQYGKNQLCNRTDGGEGFFGGKHTEETKKIIKEKNTGKKASQETLIKMSLSSKGHNRRPKGTWNQKPESVEKISKAFKGKKRSEYFCQQVKKSKVGYKPAKVTLEAAAKKKRENACLIIENKTGFIGNIFDVMDKFNLDKSHIYKLCKRKEPIKYGPNEGLDFKKQHNYEYL
jgi:hypothetical protein